MKDTSIFLSTVTLANSQISAIKEIVTIGYEATYIAFGQRGVTDLTEPKFRVCEYFKNLVTGVTTVKWANGSLERDSAFDSPETLTYAFLK